MIFAAFADAPPAAVAPATPFPASPYLIKRVVEPLREIGRVKAKSAYCTALVQSAAPSARTALQYESRLLLALDHIRHFRLDSGLTKWQSINRLEADLNAMADLALAGRTELEGLRTLAMQSDQAQHDELIALADALDGAKARQMSLARQLSSISGRLAEAPLHSMTELPVDDYAADYAFARGLFPYPSASALDSGEYQEEHQRLQDAFNTMPADEKIGDDLARAGDHARAALALGNCSP